MQYTLRGLVSTAVFLPFVVVADLRAGFALGKRAVENQTNDLWIAALLLQHSLRLHARGRHFDHLPQIVRA